MHTESAVVLDSLRPALAEHLSAVELDQLVVLRADRTRRRSSIFFVGVDGSNRAYRWVVKQPNDDSQQQDLPSPMSAAEQYGALLRLYRHLEQSTCDVSTPRPIALLPDISAYVMDYVPGGTLTDLIEPRSLIRPAQLLAGMTCAGDVLHSVHSIEGAAPETEAEPFDLDALATQARTRAQDVLQQAGLPVRASWFGVTRPPGAETATSRARVVLHGDYAPENILMSASGVYCLEPDLSERSWPEYDVARFVLMLFDAPMFVMGVDVPAVQRLRRRAASTFLDAYYRGRSRPELLRIIMLDSLASRWATRHTDLVEREPRLMRTRDALLRRHFSKLLTELNSPIWP